MVRVLKYNFFVLQFKKIIWSIFFQIIEFIWSIFFQIIASYFPSLEQDFENG